MLRKTISSYIVIEDFHYEGFQCLFNEVFPKQIQHYKLNEVIYD